MEGIIRTIGIAFICALAFERVHLFITAPNYNSMFNGFGVIDGVNRRTVKAPMAYRVLVPWLVRLIEHVTKERAVVYQNIKLVLTTLAFSLVIYGFGLPAGLAVMVFLLYTIKYDYWDWAVELAAVAAAYTGDLSLAVPTSVLLGLSKETAPIVPVVYYLRTGNLYGAIGLMAAVVVTMAIVRIVVGRRALYCKRFMIAENAKLFTDFLKWKPIYFSDISIALVITLVTIIAAMESGLSGIAPLLIILAGWTMARADETRVFTAALPWMALWVVGGY